MHYHRERNHQGLGNGLIDPPTTQRRSGPVRRWQRVGGILSYYYRSGASRCWEPRWEHGQWTGDEAQIRSVLAAPLNLDIRGEYTTSPDERISLQLSSSVWLVCESIELK